MGDTSHLIGEDDFRVGWICLSCLIWSVVGGCQMVFSEVREKEESYERLQKSWSELDYSLQRSIKEGSLTRDIRIIS